MFVRFLTKTQPEEAEIQYKFVLFDVLYLSIY